MVCLGDIYHLIETHIQAALHNHLQQVTTQAHEMDMDHISSNLCSLSL